MATVALDRLTKIYDRSHRPAAEDVSLAIAHGEFMVLLGPSGCGKTTTLRMIAGLESISAGTLSIDDRVMNAVPAKDRDIAMVFQSYALYPHMSVYDNLAFGLRRRGLEKAEIARRVVNTAQTLGLSDYLKRKPHALSGGQRQRVALGRAIVRDPKVFLFDEPLSNLDAALRVSTRGEVAALHQRLGATMIYVTHDQVEAMTLGTRICIMSEGRVVQVGPPLEVYRKPINTFVAAFLGNPPMNLLQATAIEGPEGRALKLGEARIAVPEALLHGTRNGAPLTLGIRPEHIGVRPRSEPQQIAIEAEVAQIERLGAETILIARCLNPDARITARIANLDDTFAIGSRLTLHADSTQIHIFGAEGNRLSTTAAR